MKKLFLLTFILQSFVFAQRKNKDFKYHIKKTSSTVKVDGLLSEETWKNAAIVSDFFQVLPMDTSKAIGKTEVQMAYDDKYLYLAFINYKSHPKDIVESLKPDFNFGKNDNDLIFMDTFNDQTNGFSFGSNAAGARWDGLQTEGARVNLSWENRWYTAVKSDSAKWVWEAAIPFKTLRYKKNTNVWGINFSRLDVRTTEKSAWTPIPRQFPTASLAFCGELVWDEDLPASKNNFSVIPYAALASSKDFNSMASNSPKKVGVDLKAGIGPAMNLDLTFNPDFSQVDVDRQVTNLDRFELLFPERRQFFIENGDLFTNFGFANIRPFFSRRIGLNAPIDFGAKLSGKLNANWRLGMMNIKTRETETAAQNFTTFALQRKMFTRSNINMMYVGKENWGKSETPSSYNRTIATEYNHSSKDNKLTGKAFYLRNFGPHQTAASDAFAGSLNFSEKKWGVTFTSEKVSKDFNPEVGYTPRRNYVNFASSQGYLFFPNGTTVLSHGPLTMQTIFFDAQLNQQIENEFVLGYRLNFRNTATLFAWAAEDWQKLQAAFDPTNYTGAQLAKDTEHRWYATGFDYQSKPQSLFTYNLATRYGGFYASGTRMRLNGDFSYRVQPYVSTTLSLNYNQLSFGQSSLLPAALKDQIFNFWLVGPRVDVTFTNNLYFSNFLQYNNQLKNVNFNSRVQWRYSPASDLFVVYTDNYTPEFAVKNRALVLKLTYWWNV